MTKHSEGDTIATEQHTNQFKVEIVLQGERAKRLDDLIEFIEPEKFIDNLLEIVVNSMESGDLPKKAYTDILFNGRLIYKLLLSFQKENHA